LKIALLIAAWCPPQAWKTGQLPLIWPGHRIRGFFCVPYSGIRASQASRASRPVAAKPVPPLPTLPSGLNKTDQNHRPSIGPPLTLYRRATGLPEGPNKVQSSGAISTLPLLSSNAVRRHLLRVPPPCHFVRARQAASLRTKIQGIFLSLVLALASTLASQITIMVTPQSGHDLNRYLSKALSVLTVLSPPSAVSIG
jgi:hypothetical protein